VKKKSSQWWAVKRVWEGWNPGQWGWWRSFGAFTW